MTLRTVRCCLFLIAVQSLLTLPALGQTATTETLAAVQGQVCDSHSVPLPGASISLHSVIHARDFEARANAQGHYRFDDVPPGDYMLKASQVGYLASEQASVTVSKGESKTVDLHLSRADLAGTKHPSSALQFSDEPQFQIAGVIDPTNYGGHGSDTGLRTKEALARDTESLKEEAAPPLRADASSNETADFHRQRGDAAEREGNPLGAVHEYQLAAEIHPSEQNLFAWGAELLLHRAFDPAIEVFFRGRRQFPGSVRMAVGLSIAAYDKGDMDRGEKLLLEACDVNPEDATPYLFMGRLQEAERSALPGWIDKLHRFADLAPRNAMAHYYYAVALGKQTPAGTENSAVESELRKAADLDPKLGKAYLQLGILSAEKKETAAAIAAFKKAIENLELPDEAHYRLAQIYRQNGEMKKAGSEFALYRETSRRKTRQEEEQRHEIQQFVYTLREQETAPPANSKSQ